ncbi:MAG: amidohydrolase family protein [Leptospiraceae bacterium]|nr:amidohydrolase family protein [Leptospiraceae bacterium]
MKNKLKILLFLSLFVNLVLAIFLFPKNQIRAKFFFYNILGYQTAKNPPSITNLVLVQDYDPISLLHSEDKRTSKLPIFPVMETHGHLGKFFKTSPEEVSKKLTELGIKQFVNLSFTTGEEFLKLKEEYSDPRIVHFTTFNWKRLEEENSIEKMLADLKKDIANGSRGIKLWKNFGLHLKKKNGERLKLDDPELDPIFQECEKQGLIISIHTVDPEAFFSPIDAKNERYEELLRHPEWSFYSSEFPSIETVLTERNNRFKRHPNLKFVALHFAEYANDLEKADKLLTENPNVFVDVAARIDELGRQPFKTKAFFQKFSERILFGVDGPPDRGKLEVYSRFLETNDEYFDYFPPHKPRKGFWKIYGLGLDKTTLENVYFKNAERLLKK